MSTHMSNRFAAFRGNRGNQDKELKAELNRWEFEEFNDTMEEWMNQDYGWEGNSMNGFYGWEEDEDTKFYDDDDERRFTDNLDDEHDALDEARSLTEREEHDLVWSSYSEDSKEQVRDAAFASMEQLERNEVKDKKREEGYFRRRGINE